MGEKLVHVMHSALNDPRSNVRADSLGWLQDIVNQKRWGFHFDTEVPSGRGHYQSWTAMLVWAGGSEGPDSLQAGKLVTLDTAWCEQLKGRPAIYLRAGQPVVVTGSTKHSRKLCDGALVVLVMLAAQLHVREGRWLQEHAPKSLKVAVEGAGPGTLPYRAAPGLVPAATSIVTGPAMLSEATAIALATRMQAAAGVKEAVGGGYSGAAAMPALLEGEGMAELQDQGEPGPGSGPSAALGTAPGAAPGAPIVQPQAAGGAAKRGASRPQSRCQPKKQELEEGEEGEIMGVE